MVPMTEIGCRPRIGIGPRERGFKNVYVIFEEAMAATPKNTPLRSYNSANRFVPEKSKKDVISERCKVRQE